MKEEKLHLPAVCKVKTTLPTYHPRFPQLHLPAVCKAQTTY